MANYSTNAKSTGVSVKRESIGDINVSVTVDTSEAITALKAVQREARKATAALRELESAASRRSAKDDLHLAAVLSSVEQRHRYHAKIQEICGDYYSEAFSITNDIILLAYKAGRDQSLYLQRCSGASTSILALSAIVQDVIYVPSHTPIRSNDINGKAVFVDGDIELPSGAHPKCVIKVFGVDSYD